MEDGQVVGVGTHGELLEAGDVPGDRVLAGQRGGGGMSTDERPAPASGSRRSAAAPAGGGP